MATLTNRFSRNYLFGKSMPELIRRNQTILVALTWFALGTVLALGTYFRGTYENYQLFVSCFGDFIAEQPIYGAGFVYGPVACVLFAPFGWLPGVFGPLSFLACSAALLYLAVWRLPLTAQQKNIFLLICLVDFFNTQQHFQNNAFVASFMLLAFSAAVLNRPVSYGVMVALGFTTKIFGLSGVMFALFTRNKFLSALSFVLFVAISNLLLGLLVSFDYLFSTYAAWIADLSWRADVYIDVTTTRFQDQSILGFFSRTIGMEPTTRYVLLIAALTLLCLPFLRFSCYHDRGFQFLALAAVMMFVVLFSPSSESPTYVILQCGVAAWFCGGSSLPLKLRVVLLVSVILLSSFSPTDLYPGAFGDWYNHYAARSVSCFVLWLVVLWEMVTGKPAGQKIAA